MSKKSFADIFQRWVSRGRRAGVSDPNKGRSRLGVETFEDRVVPAVLPTPTITDTRTTATTTTTDDTGTTTGAIYPGVTVPGFTSAGFAPQAVADPNDPNTIVMVAADPETRSGPIGGGFPFLPEVLGRISRDGGRTWSGFAIPNFNEFQFGGPGGRTLTDVNSPSVAFSRTGEVYVAWTNTTADNQTGRLLVSSFTVSDQTVTPLNGPVVVYEWRDQDPVFNPVVAVDNNLDEYLDPDTGATTPQDTMQGADNSGKAVYLAWNTNAIRPTTEAHFPFTRNFTPTAIFAAASADKGATFTTPVPVNDGSYFVLNSAVGTGGVAPRILFEPGDLNPDTSDTAGRLKFVWSSPFGKTLQDTTSPDGGTLATPAAAVYNSPVGPVVGINEPNIDPNNQAPDFPNPSTSTLTVSITDPNFTTLKDLDLTLAVQHPHVNQLRITLIPPPGTGVQPIVLLENRVDGLNRDRAALIGQPFAFGLPDSQDIGVLFGDNGARAFTGTTFDDQAARFIYDPANVAGYIAHFRPESGSLANFNGLTAAQLNGDWSLRIEDFYDDDRKAGNTPGVPQFLSSWSMKFSSDISNSGFGQDNTINSVLANDHIVGASANLGGPLATNATGLGIGAGASLAYDTSLGSFSPFSGRLYMVYVAPDNGGDINLIYSDNNGVSWINRANPTRVNDDALSDNFTEGNRAQFQPSVTVDPVTGTVVVTWYDARYDASNARVATYVATSIDGGDTFSVQDLTGFLNTPKQAVDEVARTTNTIEPVPTNLRAADGGTDADEAGNRQSVLAYGGSIRAFWTGNLNTSGQSVFTATVVTAAGPRIVSSDMGAVTEASAGTLAGSASIRDANGTTRTITDAFGATRTQYNNTFAADGTRLIDGFEVVFDRDIDAASFDINDIVVQYRGPNADRNTTLPPTRVPLAAITATLPQGGVIPIAPTTPQAGTTFARAFFVQFAAPQSAAGTYSYSITPDIYDRTRSRQLAHFVAADTPTPIPDLGLIDSLLTVPTPATNQVVVRLQVAVDITHTFDGDLRLTLYAPNGQAVVLSDQNGGNGDNYTNTRFNDTALLTINGASANPPFNGVFRPEQPLSSFAGLQAAGTWVLRIEDLAGGDVGTLNGWSLTFLDVAGNPITFDQSRTYLDQDADSRTRETGTTFDPTVSAANQRPRLFTDAYNVPGVVGADPFRSDPFNLPTDGNTLPLIVPGPHLVNTAVVGDATQGSAGSGDNLVLNGTARQLDVTFDRDINPASVSLGNLLRMTGPTGPVTERQDITVLGTSGTFSVTVNTGVGAAQTTTLLPYNIPANGGNLPTTSLQNALAALTNVGAGNVSVTATTIANGTVYRVVFTGLLANSPLPTVTAAGANGATPTVVAERFSIAPLGTANPDTGGYRTFRLTFPSQIISGPYTAEFGQDALGGAIRAVDRPQLVTIRYAAPIVTTIRNGETTLPEIQRIDVVAPSGTFTLTFMGDTTPALSYNATALQVQNALNALPSIIAAGGAVTVAANGTAGSIAYTVTFSGSSTFRDTDQPQLTAAFSTPNQLTVTFDRPTTAAAVQAALRRVTGPAGDITNNVTTVTPNGASTTQYLINFAGTLPAGQYVVDFDPASGLRVLNSGPAVDTNLNAGLELLRGDVPASQDLEPRTFSTDTAVPIAPAAGGKAVVSESSQVIAEDFIIRQSSLEQIQLLLNITHPDVRDLDIDLVPPEATGLAPIRLFTGSLATGVVVSADPADTHTANFTNTRLIDRVNDPNVPGIESGTPPFRSGGLYSPQTPLSALLGKSSKGVWTLRVTNSGTNTPTNDPASQTGTPQITNWSLVLPKAITAQSLSFSSTPAPSALITPGSAASPTTATLTVNVPNQFQIAETDLQQIQLLLNVNAPNVRNLDIDLIPAAGTGVGVIRLFTGANLAPSAPNQTANFTNTRLIDRTDVPSIESALPPFNAGPGGYLRPEDVPGSNPAVNPLSQLVGKFAQGTWTLRVTNRGPNTPTGDPNFNPNIPIEIFNFSLVLPRRQIDTGLGEAVADRFQAGFRIFTQDPTNPLSQQVWTPVGPAPTNETANAARITAVAADPSDPSGNTVYVSAAGGGIWKTTNFLTTDPDGPQYVPLTDFGPTAAVNVSSLAVFGRNNDPAQTVVFALTGEPNVQFDSHFQGNYPAGLTAGGIGVLRSVNGGQTWEVLDSRTNVDSSGTVVPFRNPIRDHAFSGATGYKIVVDPNPGPDGGVIVYMALSGGANPGVWRSINGGNSWNKLPAFTPGGVEALQATDVVLSAGSANPTSATGETIFNGNLQQLYAAYRDTGNNDGGAFFTSAAPSTGALTLMTGQFGTPLVRDVSIFIDPDAAPQLTPLVTPSPNGAGHGRISLSAPALTGDPLKDSYLRDWVFALASDGLYVTKDAGATWTLVRIPSAFGFGTNDEVAAGQPNGRGQFNVNPAGGHNQAVVIDPQNPNIVYIAGSGTNSLRLDLTNIRDTHNFSFFSNSDGDITAATAATSGTQINTVGGVLPRVPERGRVVVGGANSLYPLDFLNLTRDFNQPFTTNSLVRVVGTGNPPNNPLAGQWVNSGADIQWTPFQDLLDPGLPINDPTGRTENRFSATNIHAILPIIDPVTGKTRLVYGTDDGVFTGVDAGDRHGTGTVSTGIGFSGVVNFNRNGNLQISQFYDGAVQPSQFAADLAGALFYGQGDHSGFPVSSPDILATGNLNWRGPTGDGVAVLTDATGTGTAYEYRAPSTTGFDLNSTSTGFDFFRVFPNTVSHSFSGGIGRTGGQLIRSTDNPGFGIGQYPADSGTRPAVNPFNPQVLLLASENEGRVYRTTNQGVTWLPIGQPPLLAQPITPVGQYGPVLDGTAVDALAFGARDQSQPGLTDNFIYAGTRAGRIFVTGTGGAPWANISAGLDGQDVVRIMPNPQVGTRDVFAVTRTGVFYKADGLDIATPWVNITGGLLTTSRSVFGSLTDQQDNAVKFLTSLAVDWRYAIPFPNDPTRTFPVLYVGGEGGVFRSGDFGANWNYFPSVSGEGAPVEGGYLPNTHITDLDVSLGDLDTNTGRYKAGGLNMLVATTYGRGTFSIRLDNVLPANSFLAGPRVDKLINPNPVGGPSTRLNVQFIGQVDPATFTPEDVFLTGPNGQRVPVTAVKLISVPNASGVNPRNLYEIDFAPQAGPAASYSIIIGADPTTADGRGVPQISDPSGFLLNQDGDGDPTAVPAPQAPIANGEAVIDQFFRGLILNSTANSHLAVTSTSAQGPVAAGTPVTVTVEARDPSDIRNGSVNGTLTLSPAPGTGTFSTNPTTVTLVNGVATFTVTYQTAGTETINVSFNPPPTVDGTSFTTVVTAAGVSQFAITPVAQTVTAPATPTFTITAQDQFGNTATTYNSTVSLTSTGPPVSNLPETVALSGGTATFSGTFETAGTVTVTAAGPDPANAGNQIGGSATVTVNPGPVARLVVVASAGPFTVGDAVPVTVRAVDAVGNLATTLNNQPVTITTRTTGGQPGGGAVNPTNPTFVNGQATFTVTFTAADTFVVTAAAGGLTASSGPITVGAAPPPPSPTTGLPAIFAVGTGVGGSEAISVYNGNGSVRSSFTPFPRGFHNEVSLQGGGFTGGQRVAVGDITGDGVPDYVVGTGPTITASVVAYDGKTGGLILDYIPFDLFQGGVFVAVGDVTGDGISEVVITPDEGGGPRVVILRGGAVGGQGTFDRIGNFFGIDDPGFRGGARAAVGDINGDKFAEVVVSAGFGGGPRISVFDGAGLATGRLFHPVGDFFLFPDALRNGTYVAVGDVDGDGFGDIIGGAGPGGGPRVLVLSGNTLLSAGPEAAVNRPVANFFGGNPDNRGGVRVTTKNLDGDRFTDVVIGDGEGGGSRVTAYRGASLAANSATQYYAFDALDNYFGGVYVG